MIVRPEQMAALQQAAQQNFQQRLGEHLRQFFPEQYQGLDQAALQQAVQHAVDRARSYDILSERDICKYADVMSAFGRDFDTSPATAWASSILNDRSLGDAGARVNRLAEQALAEARMLDNRHKELAAAQGAAAAAGMGWLASATRLAEALKDAAESFASRILGAIVERCKAPANAADLCMGKGFADPDQIAGFVKDFKSDVLKNWDHWSPDERFEAVKKLQEKQFEDLGIPVPTISRSTDEAAGWDDPPTVLGEADASGWAITFNGHLFEKSPLSEDDQKELAKTVMHEGRHIEQYFKAAQLRAAEGADAEAIRTTNTDTHRPIDIPAAIAEEAANKPLPETSAATGAECDNYKKAKEWFDAKYGKGELSQYRLPYEDRPLEKDAFAVESVIDNKW